MAAKIINLDELIPESPKVIFKGMEHEVKPVSTQMYLQVLKARDKVKASNEQVEQVEQSIYLIRLSVPTIPEDDLRNLPLNALMALTKVIESMMEEANEGQKSGEGESLGE